MPSNIEFSANAAVTLPSGTVLRTTGLRGRVQSWTNTNLRLRGWKPPADEDASAEFLHALSELGIREQETIHIDAVPTEAGADAIEIQPTPAPRDNVHVILYQDEAGVVSWHLPEDIHREKVPEAFASRLRSGGRTAFRIKTRSRQAQKSFDAEGVPSRLRGFVSVLGRKVFKILVLPIVSEWIAQPIAAFAQKAEIRYRQEQIRAVTGENYRRQVTDEFTGWAGLKGKRSLLIVHGIFSSTEGMLSCFPESAMKALLSRYEGRIIALDQLTVSLSPKDNATGFLEQAKVALGDQPLELDILCHSRGGIVSRALVEQGHSLVPGHPCKFGKVFFAGVPNHGSLLADPNHMVDMIDAFTNLATEFPDGWGSYTLEFLLALVKLLVHSGERHLPGVAAMSTMPDQYISNVLNKKSDLDPQLRHSYAAVASDFGALPASGMVPHLADLIMDRVFSNDRGPIMNDLVVPCEGVYKKFPANTNPWFPIEQRLVFEKRDGVKHTDYFAQPVTIQALQWHLGVPGVVPPVGMALPPEIARLRSGEERASSTEARPEASAEPPREVERRPDIIYHKVIEAGKTESLVVSLSKIKAGDLARIDALRLAFDQDGTVRIFVALSAAGFEITGPDILPLTICDQVDGDRESVAFTVTPRDSGPTPVLRELRAVFWHKTTLLGSVSYFTAVVPPGWQCPLPEGYGHQLDTGVEMPGLQRRDSDLVICVQGQDKDGYSPFNLSLRSSIVGESYESRRAGIYRNSSGSDSLEKYLNDFFEGRFREYPSNNLSDAEFEQALPGWEEKFLNDLQDLGRTLWDWLPKEFTEEYQRLARVGCLPQSILIASEELVLPWELVIPRDENNNNLPPLGHAHIIGRWHPNWKKKPTPQRLRVRNGWLLQPRYASKWRLRTAGIEAYALKSLLPGLMAKDVPDLASARSELLEATDVQLVHFVGHGDFDSNNADESALILANEELLRARSFNGSALAGKASPILYLNACAVGQVGRVAGRPGGFCANFLRSGGAGVVAPYWPVNDKDAAAFALALYKELLDHRCIGQALCNLRRANPGNSTFQAFGWFGDPWASLNLQAISVAQNFD